MKAIVEEEEKEMQVLGETVKCSISGKICLTIREAGEILNSFKHHNHRRIKKDQRPCRRYRCPSCGFYHLTHMAGYLYEY